MLAGVWSTDGSVNKKTRCRRDLKSNHVTLCQHRRTSEVRLHFGLKCFEREGGSGI